MCNIKLEIPGPSALSRSCFGSIKFHTVNNLILFTGDHIVFCQLSLLSQLILFKSQRSIVDSFSVSIGT